MYQSHIITQKISCELSLQIYNTVFLAMESNRQHSYIVSCKLQVVKYANMEKNKKTFLATTKFNKTRGGQMDILNKLCKRKCMKCGRHGKWSVTEESKC